MKVKQKNSIFVGLRFILSVLLGVMSISDKHHTLFYVSAPTLNIAAGRIGLNPTGVFLGQLFSIFLPAARPILPLLLGLWALPFAYPAHLRPKRQLSPVMFGLILCFWQAIRYFFGHQTDITLRICSGILGACFLFFIYFIQSEVPKNKIPHTKGYIAYLILGIFILMVCDSTVADGLTTQIVALLLILMSGLLNLWQSILGGCLTALAASVIGADFTVFPMLLSAVAAVNVMRKWGKRSYTAALVLCTLLALLPGGTFLEHPLWLTSAPIAAAIFLSLPLSPLPKSKPQTVTSLGGQYEQLVKQVDKLQQSAKGRISFYPEIAERASALLQQAGAENISVTCAKDLLGGFFLDVNFQGGDLSDAALLGLMERAAGFALTARQSFIKRQGTFACFVRRAPFTVQCAALCKTKEGETICGDNALAFSSDQSHYVLLLSDGMGSGKDAFAQSFWTVSLIQKLLRAGLRAEGALGMVHSSLRLASEDVSFATADLCSIDLWTGQARFVKAGALSSFILRGESILEVSAISMPLGAAQAPDVAASVQTLQEDDIILLISDGAYESKDQLLFALQKYRKLSIGSLARHLMQSVLSDTDKAEDDITVLVARFCRNK